VRLLALIDGLYHGAWQILKSAATGHGGAACYGDAGAIPGCGRGFVRRSVRRFFNDGTISALPLNFRATLSSSPTEDFINITTKTAKKKIYEE
jgi:hypothetical protein